MSACKNASGPMSLWSVLAMCFSDSFHISPMDDICIRLLHHLMLFGDSGHLRAQTFGYWH